MTGGVNTDLRDVGLVQATKSGTVVASPSTSGIWRFRVRLSKKCSLVWVKTTIYPSQIMTDTENPRGWGLSSASPSQVVMRIDEDRKERKRSLGPDSLTPLRPLK